MSELAPPVSPHRATVLVGYGLFGLTVLRRLLSSAAPRGVLTWEEPRGGAAASERRIEDLALLWVPEGNPDEEMVSDGDALEMTRDLHRQIQNVGDGVPQDETFAEALAEAAKQLLSAGARSGRRGALPLGLDVIVLAQPANREAVGLLDRLLVAGMKSLANNANLQRAVRTEQALNFIAILDFDNYWDHSEGGRDLRRALHTLVEQWQSRRMSGPAFGRVYLVDGRTQQYIRNESQRIDEVILFLEFLLFEGRRAELNQLYQSSLDFPVATFGIRLMERSAGLLRRLAAARFGIGWLDYLIGDGPYHAGDPANVQRLLELYRPETLDALLDTQSLRSTVDSELSTLEQGLLALAVESTDWPDQVGRRYERAAEHLRIDVSDRARELMAKISEKNLAPLPKELRRVIEADLHDSHDPVPLGRVIRELQEALDRLEATTPPDVPPATEADELREIDALHSEYQRFNIGRVRVEGLTRWWWLFAVVLTAGLTPVVRDLLADVPKPDPMRFLLNQLFDVLQRLNNPVVVGVLIFLAVWGIGAGPLQRRIAARIGYARRYFNDPERGRFAALLRRGLAPGGGLRARIDTLVDRIVLDMVLSVRGEVTRELRRILDRLHERRREIRWLSEQLRRFLRSYGIANEELRADPGPIVRGDNSVVRYAVERGEDLDSMSRAERPYRSVQAEIAPFVGWGERYSRAFLVPLEFLDRLSRMYDDPFQQELVRSGAGKEQERVAGELRIFLQEQGSLSPGFYFKQQEGIPPGRRYCLLPDLWSRLPGVVQDLRERGVDDQHLLTGADTGRAYLLRVQTGIDPKCLLESA